MRLSLADRSLILIFTSVLFVGSTRSAEIEPVETSPELTLIYLATEGLGSRYRQIDRPEWLKSDTEAFEKSLAAVSNLNFYGCTEFVGESFTPYLKDDCAKLALRPFANTPLHMLIDGRTPLPLKMKLIRQMAAKGAKFEAPTLYFDNKSQQWIPQTPPGALGALWRIPDQATRILYVDMMIALGYRVNKDDALGFAEGRRIAIQDAYRANPKGPIPPIDPAVAFALSKASDELKKVYEDELGVKQI